MRSSSRSSWPSRNSTRRPSSRSATRTAYSAASPGRGRSAAIASARAAAECRANRARRSSGPVRISERAWLMAWVRSLRALRLATISARIASTAPSRPLGAPAARPDCAARAALTASSGSDLPLRRRSCRSARSTSTTRIAGRGQVPGQARAVAAGALDADQGDVPEPGQPAQQAGVPGRGGRELPHPQQPAEGIQRGGDVHVRVGVHAAGDGACVFYDCHCRPFSVVEGWHAPAGRRSVNPGLLPRPGRSDRQRRWVPNRDPADEPVSRQPESGVRPD